MSASKAALLLLLGAIVVWRGALSSRPAVNAPTGPAVTTPPEAGPKLPPDTVPAPAAGRLPDVPASDRTVSEPGSLPFEPGLFAVASLATPDQPYTQVRLDPGRLSQALHQLPGLAGAIADFINTRQGHAL